MVYVVAQLRLKPGTTERVCAGAREPVARTVSKDGRLFYDFTLSVTDPTRSVAEIALERDIQLITLDNVERK